MCSNGRDWHLVDGPSQVEMEEMSGGFCTCERAVVFRSSAYPIYRAAKPCEVEDILSVSLSSIRQIGQTFVFDGEMTLHTRPKGEGLPMLVMNEVRAFVVGRRRVHGQWSPETGGGFISVKEV